MGWENRRGKGDYYTRSVRRDGRVERVYVGAGDKGVNAYALDETLRQLRAAQREEMLLARSELAEAEKCVRALWNAA